MKRIIHGKMYNTDTATRIFDTSNEYYQGDFKVENSELYVTPKGSYFIAGSGGAMSRFSQCAYGGGYCGGDGIIPISREDALAECEMHGSTDEVEKFFGDMVEAA